MKLKMEQHLTVVMKAASKAICLDSENRLTEAYVQYLQCLSNITNQLLQQSSQTGVDSSNVKSVRKYVQLGQQCMERISIILDKAGSGCPIQTKDEYLPAKAPVQSVEDPTTPGNIPTPGDVKSTGSRRISGPMELAYKQNQQLLNAYRLRMARMNQNAATNLSLTIQRKMAENLAIARRQEAALAKKMKERQQRLEDQATRRFSVPTGLSKTEQEQRQVYKRILEFEQDTKWLLDLRKKLELSPKDAAVIHEVVSLVLRCKEHPLTEMLKNRQFKLYEKLHSLTENKTDILKDVTITCLTTDGSHSNIPNICDLLSPELKRENSHPWLSKVEEINNEDKDVFTNSKDSLKIRQNSKASLSEDRSVDHQLDSSPLSDNKSNTGKRDNDSKGINSKVGPDQSEMSGFEKNEENITQGETTSEMFTETQQSIKSDLENAISQNDSITKKLQDEKELISKISSKSKEKTMEEYEEEISDDIWGSDDDDDDDGSNSKIERTNQSELQATDVISDDVCVGRSESIDSTDSTDSNTRKWRSLYSESVDSEEDAKVEMLKNEAYYRHLKWLSQDVHSYMEELQVMFTVAYEELSSPEGRDQCYASLEEPFFTPIWSQLLILYRLANLPGERALAAMMSWYHNSSPKDLGVQPKLCLVLPPSDDSQNYVPYDPAIKELRNITNLSSPLLKLECLVRVSKCVCQCVEDYYSKPSSGVNKKQPSIGADDLLPILTYVVVRSQLYQVVSECQALEEFIHEGYLMGEEGYCLTSLQTAINYIVSLHQRLEKLQSQS